VKGSAIPWEIGGSDGVKLTSFYGDLFGWTLRPAGEGR
jgi:predicted enzyme related to lactoylglutathione lyase